MRFAVEISGVAAGTLVLGDMPVWGWQFRLAEESERNADARIQALVDHLEEKQLSP